ncbi:hypothetical protein [Flavobacterium sp. N1719]|uniref:hypothetical protein n=1 Tax=Flavobacterium sp. N1719 TaxID=2885633 RepID=UPI0022229D5E|nr:hypothetical protein [Flavobacterium sp. N1719]
MENNDKFFEQYKSLADTPEDNSFPGKESIWDRVESKLDQKALTKENKTWKKIAVAASVLLVVSLGILTYNQSSKSLQPVSNQPLQPENETVVHQEKQDVESTRESDNKNSIIANDKDNVLDQQLRHPESVALSASPAAAMSAPTVSNETIQLPTTPKLEIQNAKSLANQGYYNSASSVDFGYKDDRKFVASLKEQDSKFVIQGKSKKDDPLVVVDGKAVADYNAEDAESIVYLKNPLYIINGTEYTEQEVFGPNPSCPYAPIKNQEIESVTVLQADKAVDTYGKKGENGVVIITTKDGKPNPKK